MGRVAGDACEQQAQVGKPAEVRGAAVRNDVNQAVQGGVDV